MKTEELPNSGETVLCHMPVFRSGDTVRFGAGTAVVDYVIVRKGHLLVRLHAHNDPVRAEQLHAPVLPVVWRPRGP